MTWESRARSTWRRKEAEVQSELAGGSLGSKTSEKFGVGTRQVCKLVFRKDLQHCYIRQHLYYLYMEKRPDLGAGQ